MRTLYSNIKHLIQTEDSHDYKKIVKGHDMKYMATIENAWLLIQNGRIEDFGTMDVLPTGQFEEINVNGKSILPTWIDSHTHLVFAQTREQEFVDRIDGLTYEEIAKRGGGILNSAAKLNAMSEDELFEQSWQRLEEVIDQGTGAIEIKSGYGLCTEGEIKMLRVIKRLKEKSPIEIKASFLGAHAYPLAYRENHDAYIQLIIEEMLPQVAAEGLADYIDVFCEKGFFSAEETERILEAGIKYGLKPKIHANQLYNSGGVQVGVKHGAISVDHLETMDEDEIKCLQNSTTIATLLPGAAFFLAMHYQPARKLIDANVAVALASDYNPGSCPSGNMNFILSLACTQMKMTPEEAIHASTINAAAALEIQDHMGSICKGKKASFIITKEISSIAYLPYAFGTNWIDSVVV
ncbi:MAG: imidazolonepropionase [Chitinophagaceae bacterium]